MRYFSTPAWVNVMLIVMGLVFAAAGAAAIVLVGPSPKPAEIIFGAIFLATGAGLVIFPVLALRERRDDERIRREGTAATATLLAAKPTGLFVNEVPQWALRLRIDGVGAAYEATLKLLTYDPPPTGTTMGVRVDPVRREHVVLSDDPANAAPGAGAVQLGAGGMSPQVEAALAAALRQAGIGGAGTTSTINPDGSRTITTTTITTGTGAVTGTASGADDTGVANAASDADGGGAAPDAAETVRLLADLDRMHASGALGDAEFDALKRKLLGEG